MESIERSIIDLYQVLVSYEKRIDLLQTRIAEANRHINLEFIKAVEQNPSLASISIAEFATSEEATSMTRELSVKLNSLSAGLSNARYIFNDFRISYLIQIECWEKRCKFEKGSKRVLTDRFAEAYANYREYIYT